MDHMLSWSEWKKRGGAWRPVRQVADGVIIAFALILAVYLDWDLVDTAVLVGAVTLLIRPQPSKRLAGWTLVAIPFVPIFTLLGKAVRTEEASRIVFFMFTATVLTAALEALVRRGEGMAATSS